jgi:hypothetical protein
MLSKIVRLTETEDAVLVNARARDRIRRIRLPTIDRSQAVTFFYAANAYD